MKKIVVVICLIVFLHFSLFNGVEATNNGNPFETLDQEFIKSAHEANKPFVKGRINSLANASDEEKQFVIIKIKNSISLQVLSDSLQGLYFKFVGKSVDRLLLMEELDFVNYQVNYSDYIESFQRDQIREVEETPNDPFYESQWALRMLKFAQAWDISKGSKEVKVAVLDTGISRNHNDLVNENILQGKDLISKGPVMDDKIGHGTATIGIIGASINNGSGIAGGNWNVSILPIKLSNEKYFTSSNVLLGLAYAMESGCKVVNLSLGSGRSSSFEQYYITKLTLSGCIVVASAGNDGDNSYKYPASYDNVISVGACSSSGKVAYFSQHNDRVDISSPGEKIIVTSSQNASGYDVVDGTSFSAPYVCAVIALMAAINPDINYESLVSVLPEICNDKGEKGFDNYYGNGIIDAEKAVRKVAVEQGLITPKPSIEPTIAPTIEPTIAPTIEPKGTIKSVKYIEIDNAQKIVVSWDIPWKLSKPKAALVKVQIKNSSGKNIVSLYSKRQNHKVENKVFYWNGRDYKEHLVPMGRYKVVLTVGKNVSQKSFRALGINRWNK